MTAGISFAPVAELLEDGLQGPSCGRERVDGTRGKVWDDFAFDDGRLLEPAKFLGQGLGRNRYQCTLELIKFAKGQPNVYLDLSAAFSTLAVKMALTELPQRCLYSSDAPYGEPLLSRQLVEYMSPSPAIAATVLGENTQRVLKLIG